MKVKYTPGTPDGLVGKTYKVEIVEMTIIRSKRITAPLLKSLIIKYEDGVIEEISGHKLIDSIDMKQTTVRIIVD